MSIERPRLRLKHLRHACAYEPRNAFQILAGETLLLHSKLDRFNGIRGVHRIVFGLIGFDQRGENVQPIALWRACFRTP